MSSGTITLAALAAAAAFALILIYALQPAAVPIDAGVIRPRAAIGGREEPEALSGGDAITAVRFTDPSAEDDIPVAGDDGPGEIRGGVIDARTGRPLIGAMIEILDAASLSYVRGGEELGHGIRIPGLALGAYVVRGTFLAYRPGRKDVTITGDALVHTVSVELRPAPLLSVRVRTPEGTPFADAIRKARPNAAGDLLACATIDPLGPGTRPGGFVPSLPYGAGRFHPPGVLKRLGRPPEPGVIGGLELIEAPPVFAALLFEGRVLATKAIGPDDSGSEFILRVEDVTAKEAAVRFRLVDGLTAATARDAWFIIDETTWLVERIRLDAESHIIIPALAPGPHRLRAGATDRAEVELVFDAAAGNVTELGTVVLSPCVSLSGTVLLPDGTGARAQVRVFALDAGDATLEERLPQMTLSDGQGRFEIRNLVPRRYAVAAEISEDVDLAAPPAGEGRYAGAGIIADASTGSASGLELRVQASVETRIQGGRPEAGLRSVTIRTPDGLPCWMRRDLPGPATLYLEPGPYIWEAEDTLGRGHRLTFTVPAGPSAMIFLADNLR